MPSRTSETRHDDLSDGSDTDEEILYYQPPPEWQEKKRSISVNNVYMYQKPAKRGAVGAAAAVVASPQPSPHGRNNRMSWWSHNEQYGSFTPKLDKTYLPNLPQATRNVYVDKLRQKLPSSNSEYGNFYSVEDRGHGVKKFQLQRHPVLPSIGTSTYVAYDPQQCRNVTYDTRSNPTPSYNPGNISDQSTDSVGGGKQRHHPTLDSNQNNNKILVLPDITEIDIQLLTKDYSAVSLRPTGDSCEYSAHPEGLTSVRVADISEVGLRIKQKDGSILNFYATPK